MITSASALTSSDSERVIQAFQRAVASPRLSGSEYVHGWVCRIHCQGLSPEGRVRLAAPDKFYRDFIDDHFRDDLVCSLEAELSTPIEIEWVIDTNLKAHPPPVAVAAPALASPPLATSAVKVSPESTRIDERFVFDNFVSAPSNQLAYAGAQAVADNPGKAFNPLFLYGGTGLGKTHLLHAIGNNLLKKNPACRIFYCSSEEFTNEFILAVRDHKMPEFRRKYREECECLLIDDIQFLGTKEMTQDEFFFTFNALQMATKPVAITSDTMPSEIRGLADRLKSRFASGLIADIQEPTFETRVAILKKKAEQLCIELPDQVCHYIARVVQKNVRELQMALNRVYAHHSLTGQPLTEALAAHILKDVLPATRPLDVQEVQKAVAKYYKVSESDLKGPRRQKQLVRARQVAMYLARTLTQASFPAIGEQLNRDHSTVMSACEKIEDEMASNSALRREIDELASQLSR